MSAQERFDAKFITSSEIRRRLNITRGAVVQAREKGILPDAILVDGKFALWEREHIEPHVKAWEDRRRERIGVA